MSAYKYYLIDRPLTDGTYIVSTYPSKNTTKELSVVNTNRLKIKIHNLHTTIYNLYIGCVMSTIIAAVLGYYLAGGVP